MEYIAIILVLTMTTLILAFILKINVKKIKQMAKDKSLHNLVNRFPKNTEVCKAILKKLNNEGVIVEENKESKTSLYIAITNKIIIANIQDTYTRIQTIAHECVHSIQSRRLLVFNFIYSNLYMLYFILILILKIFGILQRDIFQIVILIILGEIYYFIRSYLETDAMIKARYLAKEYIEESNLCTKEECQTLMQQYDKLNTIGIPLSNLSLLCHTYTKIIVFCIVCLIVHFFTF